MALLRPETMKARHVVTTKVVTTWLFSEEFKMGEGKIDLGRVSSIIDVLDIRADIQSDQLSYVFLSDGAEVDRLTFAQLQRRARAVAAYLQAMKAQNERALLLYPAGLDYVVAFYACLYGKAVAVPAYPPRMNQNLRRLLAIIEDAKPIVALTASAIYSRLQRWFDQAPSLKSIRWVITDGMDPGLADVWAENKVDEETMAFLQYTSGSTATPKGVMVSHGNLIHNQAMMRESLKHDDDTVIVSWLPMYHDMGLIGNILAGVYNGAPCYLMAHTDFLQKPACWLEAISKYRATFSGGPNFAYELCARKARQEQREELDLSCWRTAFNGSEPIRAETLRQFAEAFTPYGFRPEALYPCYGLAEATLFVSGGAVSNAPVVTTFDKVELEKHRAVASDRLQDGVTLVSSGKPCLGERIVTVNPQTLIRCDEGQVGEIWVSGAAVAQGYWGRPELTHETFRARLSDTREGPYLRTGDLGVIFQGALYVTGRIKDLIVIRGRNHYPQDIELTAESSHPALRPGCSAAFAAAGEETERLILVAEINRERRNSVDMNEVVESVRQAILIEHEIGISDITLIRPGSLPKTSSGKIQRSAVRSAFLSGVLNTVYRSEFTASPLASGQTVQPEDALRTLGSLRDWLSLECSSRLNIGPNKIDVDQPIACYWLDSLAATEFVVSIEESFGVQIHIDKLFRGAPSISDLALFLYEQLQPAPPSHGEAISQGIGIEGRQMAPHQVIPLSYPTKNERSDKDDRRTRETSRSPVLQPCEPAPRSFDVAA
jgi:acyl-CoA synthetase (AMP-forming)/AMP-acid ligase II/acyl carrier protein